METKITQNVEDITKQVLDINRKYINKSIEVIGQLKNSSRSGKISNISQDMVADVFNGIVKLNLEYYSKLMDYGFSVTDRILSSTNEEEQTGSSFTLSGTTNPGTVVNLGFVLDNSKEVNVLCQLESSSFVNIDDETENQEISVDFRPQSFELETGKSVNIDIVCSVSEKSAVGTFYTHAKVIGFEPAYFTIVLNIEKNGENASENISTEKASRE